MILDPNQTLAGIPILRIRTFLRKVQERRWDEGAVDAAFAGAGSAVLEALIGDGYAQPTSEPGLYKTTLKGDTLASAAAPKPGSPNHPRR